MKRALMLLTAIGLAALCCFDTPDAAAQQRRPMGGPPQDDSDQATNALGIRAPREAQEKAGLVGTGLRPVYPAGMKCREVASFFGDQTRYDGSSRVGEANNGFHAGMDISAPEGTPLLAVADGIVIDKRERGLLAGVQIFLHHAPADSGLPVWIVSKYQHLREPSNLAVGERVTRGQVIGLSGMTGTIGPHYRSGYPHLHLSLYAGATERYTMTMGGPLPVDGKFLDPLALYVGKAPDNHALRALTDAEKRFPLPYRTADGKLVPADTRVVWPFLCDPR